MVNSNLTLANVVFTPLDCTDGHANIVSSRRGGCELIAMSSRSSATVPPRPRVALLYPGQGAQYVGMARSVYERDPAFRAMFDMCADCCALPLRRLVFAGEEAVLGRTDVTQPAMFVIECALTAMLNSWGLRPDVTLGHSIGEYAAAYAAGMITAEEGCRLVLERGRLMRERCERSALVAVSGSEADLVRLLAAHPGLEIAIQNTSRSVVVGGSCHAAERFCAAAAAAKRPVRTLAVSHAFHTRFMDPMLRSFGLATEAIGVRRTRGVAFISAAAGEELDRVDGRYWVQHVRGPVRFAQALHSLADCMPEVVIEVGPGRTLVGLARSELGKDVAGAWLTLLSPREDEWGAVTSAAEVLKATGAIEV